jgi:hypothetical protein
MALLAALAGITGYVLASRGTIVPPAWIAAILPHEKHARFMADWWAHNASYLAGLLGGIVLCILTIRKRLSISQ